MNRNPNFIYPDYGQKEACTHYAHRDFGESVNANFVPVSPPEWVPGGHSTIIGKVITGRHIEKLPKAPTIFEFADVIHAAPEIKRQHPDQPLILLGTHRMLGRGLYKLNSTSVKGRFRDYHRELEQWVNKTYLDYCDGVIAVSDLVQEFIRIEAPHTTTERVYPHIDKEFEKDLANRSPSLTRNHAVTVCKAREHKGVDMLVDAWPTIREKHPDATLSIVGQNHPERYEYTEGVSVHGYVDDLGKIYEKSSLYIHPARVDAFGVTVTEGMRAGLPALVTYSTGAKAPVHQLGDEFVVESRPQALAEGVSNYFESEHSKRQTLSQLARGISKKYNYAAQTESFSESYKNIISRV